MFPVFCPYSGGSENAHETSGFFTVDRVTCFTGKFTFGPSFYLSEECKKKRDTNFKHSLKLRTCISFIYVFKTKQRLNTRHGDNKREIIWDIPKATLMAIVPVVVERYAQHSYSSSLCPDSLVNLNYSAHNKHIILELKLHKH